MSNLKLEVMEGSGASIWNRTRHSDPSILEFAAAIVSPSLYPEDSVKDTVVNQSFVAGEARKLSSKLADTLFPRARASFALTIPEKDMEELNQDEQHDMLVKLSDAAETAANKINKYNLQEMGFQITLAAMTMGQAVYNRKTKRIYPATAYTLKRDVEGELSHIVIRSGVDKATYLDMTKDVRSTIAATHDATFFTDDGVIDLYNVYERIGNQWHVRTFLGGHDEQVGPTVKYGRKAMPIVVVPWEQFQGNDYGTGIIEANKHDIDIYDSLAGMVNTAAAKSMDFRNMVDPSAGIDIIELNEGEAGDYIAGRPDAIQTYTGAIDGRTFSEVYNHFQMLEQRIAKTFTNPSGSVRQAERVTSAEISMLAQEADQGLGGVYANLSEFVQRVLIEDVISETNIKDLDVEIVLNTGADALSNLIQVNSFRQYVSDLTNLSQVAQIFGKELDTQKILSDLTKFHSLPMRYVNSPAKIKAKEEEEQQAAQAQQQPMMPGA